MKLHVFNIRISLISAVRLAGEDRIKEILKLDELPKDLRPLLRQEVIPRSALAPLTRLKTEATRELLKHATRNPFGGWNIDPESETCLMQPLEEIQRRFEQAKKDLVTNLAGILDDHIEALANACNEAGYGAKDAFLSAVRMAQPTRDYIERQVQFTYLKPRTVEYDDETEAPVLREGVYAQVLHEIAMRAKAANAAQGVKSRLRAIDEMVTKFRGLSYIVTDLGRIGRELAGAMSGIPVDLKEAEYDATQIMAVRYALSRLEDEERLASAVESGEPLFDLPASAMASAEADKQESFFGALDASQQPEVESPPSVAPVQNPPAADNDSMEQLPLTGTFAW